MINCECPQLRATLGTNGARGKSLCELALDRMRPFACKAAAASPRPSAFARFSLQARNLDFGGFLRTTINGGQKVVKRISELSESEGLNQRST
jgi:hypothetical protein